jgi:hypothetical protein
MEVRSIHLLVRTIQAEIQLRYSPRYFADRYSKAVNYRMDTYAIFWRISARSGPTPASPAGKIDRGSTLRMTLRSVGRVHADVRLPA